MSTFIRLFFKLILSVILVFISGMLLALTAAAPYSGIFKLIILLGLFGAVTGIFKYKPSSTKSH